MTKYFCALFVAVSILSLSIEGTVRGGEPLKRLATTRLKAAKDTYGLFLGVNERFDYMRTELYFWSKRILDCELELASNKDARVAAFRAHLDRMTELENLGKTRLVQKLATEAQASATQYYRQEAEFWIAKAKMSD